MKAEWFTGGKTAYLTPKTKWRKAAIKMDDERIEVSSRKVRQPLEV